MKFIALEFFKENYICFELLLFCFDLMVLEAIRAGESHQVYLNIYRNNKYTVLNSVKEYQVFNMTRELLCSIQTDLHSQYGNQS